VDCKYALARRGCGVPEDNALKTLELLMKTTKPLFWKARSLNDIRRSIS
jgi:hypothetical protein